jgi:hypothetical protein
MQRRISQLFLNGPARLLPTINLITDIGNDPALTDLPMPVPALKRRLEITQLVRGLLTRVDSLAPRSAVFDLANSLAALMDEMKGEGIEPKATLKTVQLQILKRASVPVSWPSPRVGKLRHPNTRSSWLDLPDRAVQPFSSC